MQLVKSGCYQRTTYQIKFEKCQVNNRPNTDIYMIVEMLQIIEVVEQISVCRLCFSYFQY